MKKVVKILLVIVVFSMLAGLIGCKGKDEVTAPDMTPYPIAKMTIKNYGTLEFKLYPNNAPETVRNFIKLANEGFYDGKTLRAFAADSIVGGDEKEGQAGCGYAIKGEFAANKYDENKLSHIKGTLSMSRGDDYDSGSSQFFIMTKDNVGLNGHYACFGRIINGASFELLDKIVGDVNKEDLDADGIYIDESKAPVIERVTVDTFGKDYGKPTELVKIYYTANPEDPNLDATNYPIVTMEVENYGNVVMKLYPNKAPETVNSFITLINSGFYDGLTFHRIIKEFVVQGGDPKGDGTGGPGYTIKGEFPSNGFTSNNISHVRGALSMARGGEDNDSAGSQFFIVQGEDGLQLNGKYAAFGMVIEGMEIVDKMAEIKVSDDNGTLADPSKAPKIKSITVNTFGKTYPEPNKTER